MRIVQQSAPFFYSCSSVPLLAAPPPRLALPEPPKLLMLPAPKVLIPEIVVERIPWQEYWDDEMEAEYQAELRAMNRDLEPYRSNMIASAERLGWHAHAQWLRERLPV
jgi:hypothetical protein